MPLWLHFWLGFFPPQPAVLQIYPPFLIIAVSVALRKMGEFGPIESFDFFKQLAQYFVLLTIATI